MGHFAGLILLLKKIGIVTLRWIGEPVEMALARFGKKKEKNRLEQEHPIILFDGICNYCNRVINGIIRHDKKGIFRFATLQSAAGQELLRKWNLPTDQFDSFLLIDKGKVYSKSTAALRLYNKLPWYWKWTQLFWIFPVFLRNGIYGIIARNRYKWFGKRNECMVPTAGLKQRFLN